MLRHSHKVKTLSFSPVLRYSFAFTATLILHGVTSTWCWKHSSSIVSSYWHNSVSPLLQICQLHIRRQCSCFTTFWRCCFRLRSGGCGGRWRTLNSLSCSRKPVWEVFKLFDTANYPGAGLCLYFCLQRRDPTKTAPRRLSCCRLICRWSMCQCNAEIAVWFLTQSPWRALEISAVALFGKVFLTKSS